MKKNTTLLALSVLFFLLSCKKECDDRGINRESLAGTVWISLEKDDSSERVLKFHENDVELCVDNGVIEKKTGVYKYEYPYVLFSIDGENFRAIVVNNYQMFVRHDNEKIVFVFQF